MSVKIVPVNGSLDDLKTQLKGSRLVIPSISIGNVPQLSADLFLHNLGLQRVAQLDSLYLYPFASPVDYVDGDDQHKGSVSTALELYYNEELKLSVIQQRSPILPEYSQNFLDYLVSVVKYLEFDEVLLLDSNDQAFKADLNHEKPIELYSNDLTERFKSLNVSNTTSIDKAKELFTIFTSGLISSLNDIKGVSVTALLIYVYEGDNFYDAQIFTKEALKVLEIKEPASFKTPKSWDGVYGDRPIPTGYEDGLFG